MVEVAAGQQTWGQGKGQEGRGDRAEQGSGTCTAANCKALCGVRVATTLRGWLTRHPAAATGGPGLERLCVAGTGGHGKKVTRQLHGKGWNRPIFSPKPNDRGALPALQLCCSIGSWPAWCRAAMRQQTHIGCRARDSPRSLQKAKKSSPKDGARVAGAL